MIAAVPSVGVAAQRREIRQDLRVVGAKRIIEEMMLDRPDDVEAEFVGEAGEADFLLPGLAVAHAGPAVAGEDHLNADVHAGSPGRGLSTAGYCRDRQNTREYLSRFQLDWQWAGDPAFSRLAVGRRSPGNLSNRSPKPEEDGPV
jgi:hypothetical protein